MILESKKTGQHIVVTPEQYQILKNSGQYRNFKVVDKDAGVKIPETFKEVMDRVITLRSENSPKTETETNKQKNGRKKPAIVLPDKSVQQD